MHAQGLSARQSARTRGLARRTVQRCLRAEGFPERQPRRPRPTLLTPDGPYLRERWAAGCRNAAALWREVRAQGLTGGYSGGAVQLARWREDGGAARPAPAPAPRRFSVREATWLRLGDPETLDQEEHAYVAALTRRCPEAEQARELARRFLALVRERDHAALAAWAEQVEQAAVPDRHAFAAGLGRDWAAVSAGLELPWSNGQTEGQVNRRKLLKRQLYGRAGFELLRHRFLLTG